MSLSRAQQSAIELAGDVKAQLVAFALTPPFQRHLRRIVRELSEQHPDTADPGVTAVEQLLFEFRYDDGSRVVDRFVKRRGLRAEERAMALGFLDGVHGFFELVADLGPGVDSFPVRCCMSDLDHLIAPTLREGLPTASAGAFLVGRLVPVAGTDLWTLSGAHELLPASARQAVANSTGALALQAPWLTHRNPDYLAQARTQVAAMHERFVSQHGTDLDLVAASALPDVYAEVIVGDDVAPEVAASSRAMARRTIEDTELLRGGPVLVHSDSLAGLGFYQAYPPVARALTAGAGADPDDLAFLRDYLDDPGIPAWALRRIVTEHLPAAEGALAVALRRPAFSWQHDGERLLASSAGDQQPMPTIAILPSICTAAG